MPAHYSMKEYDNLRVPLKQEINKEYITVASCSTSLFGDRFMHCVACFKKFSQLVYYTEISNLTCIYTTFPSN
jgi:hypothetical protein